MYCMLMVPLTHILHMLLPPLFAALARLVFAPLVVLAPQSGQSAGVLSTASSSVPT